MTIPTTPLLPLLLLSLSLAATRAESEPVKTATSKAAKTTAAKWLDDLPDAGLVLVEKSAKSPLAGRYNADVKSTSFRFTQPGWWLTLGFSGKVTKDTTLEQLRERLKFVALDKLPTPGLEIPGWEVKPRTPMSSFKKGVEIVSLEDSEITLRVKTKFFALYGTDPKAMSRVPADAGAPASAYFQIRKPFALDLTLTAKLATP